MQPVELISDGMAAVGKVLGIGPDGKEPQNAIAILIAQHREADTLFAEIDAAGERAYRVKEKALGTLIEKLLLHTELEEAFFYPAAKAIDTKLVLESVEEHANVKAMLKKLLGADARSESFAAKVTVLKELVQHHVKEEEADLFPKCKDQMSDELLDELGEKMRVRIAGREAGARRKPALKAAAKKKGPAKKKAAKKRGAVARVEKTRH